MKNPILFLIFSVVFSCSHSKTSEVKVWKKPVSVLSVKISRNEAKENCEAAGVVRGTYLGLKPNLRKALEDMRQKAFELGANYVRLDSTSEGGTTAQGMSFKCPES